MGDVACNVSTKKTFEIVMIRDTRFDFGTLAVVECYEIFSTKMFFQFSDLATVDNTRTTDANKIAWQFFG
jgi:hypothetical protein